MTSPLTTPRAFMPGTTGWSADDLDDPDVEREWERGAYEIVEGVLTIMPPAYFDGSMALQNLIDVLKENFDRAGRRGAFGPEVDLIIGKKRVARVDAVWMSQSDLDRQKSLNASTGKNRLRYGRLLVPPTLVIESISMGHADHDRETKRRWYAEFGVPNYWLLDAYEQTLECLKLDRTDYAVDCAGRGESELRPSSFPGLLIPLRTVWGE